MIYHFLVISDESDDFLREIQINANATFLELHNAIQASVGYDNKQLASFFLTDDQWKRGTEITLLQMDEFENSATLIMENCTITDYIHQKKAKLFYQFDLFGNRGFFIELANIINDKSLDEAKCFKTVGIAPDQLLMDEALMDEFSFDFEDMDDDFALKNNDDFDFDEDDQKFSRKSFEDEDF